MKKKLLTLSLTLALGTCYAMSAFAGAKVGGKLNVSYHIVPILKDEACAYTTLSTPTKCRKECESYTTVKIYNGDGDYKKGTYAVSGEQTWDLPLNAGAKAKIRNAKKAVGTHKALSYDTGYRWLSAKDTKWSR